MHTGSNTRAAALRSAWATAVALGAFASTAHAQYFIDNQSDIPSGSPSNNSFSENIDFGDVDLDGDWDAVFADGGDQGNDQNRIWINLGGLQAGSIGVFSDQTGSRFPSVQDDSRDIEFADIDNDRDLDIYVSNTAQLSNQGNKWWVNQGFTQGGTLGFYQDDTAARWINLASGNSSIPNAALIGGTFIDWSCDCDFGDLDNDGDLDLVHSSYGGAFAGNVPTRLFLNDGTGHFEEFNPSGFQLSGNNIQNGNPALWCEGTQQSNTTNSNGTSADIASSALDIDIGDIDGDFDLDILHGARQELPRMFENRLEENGGSTLGFRDVTGSAFPSGYSSGDGHYEQEMADLDFDGDLDIYGLNWDAGGFNFDDLTLRNNGNGVYSILQTLSSSGDDDNEGDFFDYNGDGDIDLFVGNFSGRSKLYANTGSGTLNFVSSSTSGMSSISNFVALDVEIADVDKDGDYDIFQSNDSGSRNQFFENTLNQPDVDGPYIPNVEDPGNQTATAGVVVIRAHVYDNAPYYITWYNPTEVAFGVNGFDIGTRNARSSAGQVFRAELPKQLVGTVDFTWNSEDEYGNTGSSSVETYNSTTGATFQSFYGSGTADANANEPTVELLALAIPGERTWWGLTGSPNASYILAYAAAPSGFFLPGFGNINIDPFTATTTLTGALDGSGEDVFTRVIPGFLLSGQKLFMQAITFAAAVPTPTVGTSQGLEVTFQ